MAKRKALDLPFAKPKFNIPTMKQINRVKPNGLTVASLFCGCGGSSLGYRMAGFKVVYAADFYKHAVEAYQLNARPHTIVEQQDVTELDGKELLERIGEVDVLDGSPPCQTFSVCNTHQTPEEKLADAKSNLFMDYARILNDMQPKVFVAENVSGMVRGANKGIFKQILQALMDCGYQVECRMLDAQWLGVPQKRKRLIFIGVRNDLDIPPAFPDPFPYRYSLREVFPDIEKMVEDTKGNFSRKTPMDEPCVTLTKASRNQMFVKDVQELKKSAAGREMLKLKPGEQSKKHFSMQRAHPDEPSPCITKTGHMPTHTGGVVHPFEMRKFTVNELKTLCSFPKDFMMECSEAQQGQRVGNAVPPLMMKAVAATIRDRILK